MLLGEVTRIFSFVVTKLGDEELVITGRGAELYALATDIHVH